MASGEAAFELREDGCQALVAHGLVFQACVVAFSRRLGVEFADDVGACGFGYGTLFDEALGAQSYFFWQLRQHRLRRGVEMVSLVWQVGYPAIFFDLTAHGATYPCWYG